MIEVEGLLAEAQQPLHPAGCTHAGYPGPGRSSKFPTIQPNADRCGVLICLRKYVITPMQAISTQTSTFGVHSPRTPLHPLVIGSLALIGKGELVCGHVQWDLVGQKKKNGVMTGVENKRLRKKGKTRMRTESMRATRTGARGGIHSSNEGRGART